MSLIEATRLSPVMSNRKLQVLAFIRQYHAAHGEGPSLSEIAQACRTTRPRVQDAIRKLAAEGRIHRVPGKARSVRPIDDIAEALRQLRAVGYTLSPPPPAMTLIDLDAQGRLTVTNTSLPPAPARAHDAEPDGKGGSGGGQGEDGWGENRDGQRG